MKRGPRNLDTLGLSLAVVALLGLLASSAVAQEKEEKEQEHERQAFVVRAGGASGGYLGVRLREVNEGEVGRLHLAEERGALIVDVVDDTPAQEAGLKADDVIQTWNGTPVESAAQLGRLARETPSGRTVHLGVFRDGRQQEISVKLGERSGLRSLAIAPQAVRIGELMDRVRARTGERGPSARAFFFASRGRLGVRIQSMSDQLADYFGVKEDEGALISEVVEDSPAEKAGLKAGDVILSVAGEDVDGPGDVFEALRGRDAGPVDVRIMRDHQEQTVTVQLEKGRGEGAFLGPEMRFQYAPTAPAASEFHLRVPTAPTAPVAPLEWHYRTAPEVEIVADGLSGADWEEWAQEWERWGQEMAGQAQEMRTQWTKDWKEQAEQWRSLAEEAAENWQGDWAEQVKAWEPQVREWTTRWQDWARQWNDTWQNSSANEVLYD